MFVVYNKNSMSLKPRIFIGLIALLLQSCSLFSYSKEVNLLLGRMVRNPVRTGAILPTSTAATHCIAREALQYVDDSEDYVVELGAGTGCITAALLARGVAPDRLICVELDPELHKYMVERFPADQYPGLQIILGDATKLENILAEKSGKVAAIVTSIPMTGLPLEIRQAIAQACYNVLTPQGKVVQLSYRQKSAMTIPGMHRQLGGFVLLNLPPAFVWTFTKVQ